MKRRPLAWIFVLALCTFPSSSCDTVDEENDIFVVNGSGCSLSRVLIDGIDRGSIGNGETRRFDDVPDGVHHLEAFRYAEDTAACDTHTTEDLRGDDDDYWTIQCACN